MPNRPSADAHPLPTRRAPARSCPDTARQRVAPDVAGQRLGA